MEYNVFRTRVGFIAKKKKKSIARSFPDSDRRRVLSVTKRIEHPANERHHPDRPDPINQSRHK